MSRVTTAIIVCISIHLIVEECMFLLNDILVGVYHTIRSMDTDCHPLPIHTCKDLLPLSATKMSCSDFLNSSHPSRAH